LVLFDDADDWEAVERSSTPAAAVQQAFGVVTQIMFEPETASEGAAEERQAHGWALAAPNAYPRLYVSNGPGGGLTTHMFKRLTRCLHALAGAIASAPGPLSDTIVVQYRDRTTGIQVDSLPALNG